jgi:hypothetical protein
MAQHAPHAANARLFAHIDAAALRAFSDLERSGRGRAEEKEHADALRAWLRAMTAMSATGERIEPLFGPHRMAPYIYGAAARAADHGATALKLRSPELLVRPLPNGAVVDGWHSAPVPRNASVPCSDGVVRDAAEYERFLMGNTVEEALAAVAPRGVRVTRGAVAVTGAVELEMSW